MTPERYQKILTVLQRRQPDLTVITDQVHKGQNLSAIIRTCDAVGIHRVHAVYQEGPFRPHTGTALGSHKWVETTVHRSIGQPIGLLQQQGFQVIAAHFTPGAVDYTEVDYTRPTALLLGAEKWGVSEHAGPEDADHDGQAHGRLGRGHGDGEHRQDLPVEIGGHLVQLPIARRHCGVVVVAGGVDDLVDHGWPPGV